MSEQAKNTRRLLPLLAAVFIALLAYFSPVANTNSDSHLGLLVSQTMLRHRTVQMDANREAFAPIINQAFVTIDGHLYYYFPLGTPIFAMPVVGVANLLGYDMAVAAQEAALQNFISAVLAGLSFLVLYRACRCFLPGAAALLLTTTTFLGSALISTISTALWSIDFAVLFVSLTLLLLAKQSIGESGRSYPYLMGLFLFSAYLSRPSTFLFVTLALGYLLLVDRRTFWRTAVTAFILLAAFLLFIRLGYGSWLPPYYNDFGRLAVERPPLHEAILGNLISPSRGLFIYSPIFLPVFAGAAAFFSTLKRKPLYWLLLLWFFLQLILVARTTRWWGGLSFGPRLLTEMLPGLILLSALVTQVFLRRVNRPRIKLSAISLYTMLAVWAIFLNSYQALFNQYTAFWHSALAPNIDFEPDYLWRWDYPQFLADNDALCRRDREYIQAALSNPELVRNLYPYYPGRPLSITENEPVLIYKILEMEGSAAPQSLPTLNKADNQAYLPFLFNEGQDTLDFILSGWSSPQFGYRWSMCETAAIAFKLHNQVDAGQTFVLAFHSGSFGRQRVNISLNGVELEQIIFDGPPTPPVTRTITVPPNTLRPGAANQITFQFPDSLIPDLPKEDRRLAFSFVSFSLCNSESPCNSASPLE